MRAWAFNALIGWKLLKAMWANDKGGTLRFMAGLPGVRTMIAKLNERSWKTTAGGIGGILAGLGIIANAIASKTPVDWVATIGAAFAAISAGVGLLMARDNDKTSADVGADVKSEVREAMTEAKK